MAVPRALESRVAAQAWPLSIGLAGAAAVCALLGWAIAAVSLVALALGNLAFFRNPRRPTPPGERAVLAPADGRVVAIDELDDPDGFVGSAKRVAIFLSIFNVHVNRAPLSATVRGVRRRGSRFLAAFRGEASDRNVQVRMDLESPDGIRLAVVQITGLIARRIVCYPGEGDGVIRGDPYGLICYGSRVEIYLPRTAVLAVQPGDRVVGGVSVIAEVKP